MLIFTVAPASCRLRARHDSRCLCWSRALVVLGLQVRSSLYLFASSLLLDGKGVRNTAKSSDAVRKERTRALSGLVRQPFRRCRLQAFCGLAADTRCGAAQGRHSSGCWRSWQDYPAGQQSKSSAQRCLELCVCCRVRELCYGQLRSMFACCPAPAASLKAWRASILGRH